MSGHNKWAQIKRQKEKTDKQKSKIFTKYARLISAEVRVSGKDSHSSQAIINNAKKENVPKDVIERAIKKATDPDLSNLSHITYEAYGPGGSALIIESTTSNRNKAIQEIRHILSKNGFSLATQGSVVWAFSKTNDGWEPNATIELSEEDLHILEILVSSLEENDEVEEVFTNVQ